MKRYQGNILLIELLIVILFFSLSQVVMVRVFASAHEKSHTSVQLRHALIACQDVAEQLSVSENPDALLLKLEFSGEDGSYFRCEEKGFDIYVHCSQEDTAAGTLLTSTVTAQKDNNEILSLPVSLYVPKEGSL
ncbi:MAG: hypothetical protein E7320_03280 [Clostridiales bacterium]|nr:hypothetical protein [Clostridiales bacterium]